MADFTFLSSNSFFFQKKVKKDLKKKTFHLPVSLKNVSLQSFLEKWPEKQFFGNSFEKIIYKKL